MPCEPSSEEKSKELPEWSEKVAHNILSGTQSCSSAPMVSNLEPVKVLLIDFYILNNRLEILTDRWKGGASEKAAHCCVRVRSSRDPSAIKKM